MIPTVLQVVHKHTATLLWIERILLAEHVLAFLQPDPPQLLRQLTREYTLPPQNPAHHLRQIQLEQSNMEMEERHHLQTQYLAQWQRHHAEHVALTHKVSALQSTHEELSAKLQEQLRHKQELEEKVRAFSSMGTDLPTLELTTAKRDSLEEERQRLDAQNTQLQESTQLRAEELQKMQQECAYQEEHHACQQQVHMLKVLCQKQAQRKQQLTQQLHNDSLQQQQLRLQREKVTQETRELQEQQKTMHARLQEQQPVLDAMKERAQAFKQECEQMRQQITDHQSTTQRLTARVQGLTQQLMQVSIQTKAQAQEEQRWKSMHARSQQKEAELHTKCQRMQTMVDSLASLKDRYTWDLEMAQHKARARREAPPPAHRLPSSSAMDTYIDLQLQKCKLEQEISHLAQTHPALQ